ncbi:YdbH domain-containing protein [Azospirillum sp. B506]|uniref:intermembrane phospholipid transport protein YdbH family protein n=1 Tax=Azospirillum sp. B506 TaxID=137721 RepID=UPI000345CD58|nr:YdbH domain-containing protein [Azospirillum sp. B506]
MRLGRAMAGTAAVVLTLGVVGLGGAILAGPTIIGTTATESLRRAGLADATVTVTRMRVADGWRGLLLEFAGDSGPLETAAKALDLPVAGRLGLTGAIVIGMEGGTVTITSADPPSGLSTVPSTACLSAKTERLVVSGQHLDLPQGGTVCPVQETPLLRWSPNGNGMAVAAELRIPRIDLQESALRAEQVALRLDQDGAARRAAGTVARLTSMAKPAPVVPLAVTLRAAQSGEGPWTIDGGAEGANGLLDVTLVGSYDQTGGIGRLEAVTKAIRLAENGPGLAAISPLAATFFEKASGTLSGKATLALTDKGFTTAGQAVVKGLAGAAGPVVVTGVNGTVALSSLSPPVIPVGQKLSIGLLDVGIPLTDGTLLFGYGRDGRLDVDRAEWRWAGGTLRADPFELSPEKPKGSITLHADGIDAAKLLELIAVDGLEASGTLAGSLPVVLAGDKVTLHGGVLESSGPGTLRYDPAQPPSGLKGEEGSPTAMLMGALTDFRYDTLRITIDGQAGGELSAGFSLRGSNPSFYDGYPVVLNLKLSGALDRILRQNLDVYRIPDTLRDRLTGSDQKDH